MNSSVSTLPPPLPHQWRKLLLNLGLAGLALGLLAWSWIGIGMELGTLIRSGPQLLDFADRMFPPNLAWHETDAQLFAPPLRLAGAAVVITLQISILGTALGTAAALLFGFLAAENLTPHWLHHAVKTFLALLRSIPVIILALLFVGAVGLGAVPGVLAIAIHSVGMLGKLFAEECESVDGGVWESMDSAGANWFQKIRYAIWPQVAPQICSLMLFRLDMNIRESAVLGLVGVAGLGLWIENYRRAIDYPSVATLILVTMLVVLAVEQTSLQIRKRLR